MEYRIFITNNILTRLKCYFDVNPFYMQAAFALVEVNVRPECSTILFSDFIGLNDSDYECHTHNQLSFYSKSLLNILRRKSYQDKLCFVYIHSHNLSDCCKFENEDINMIFRIAYAYIPFGIHASLYYTHGEISGKIWLPTLSTEQLIILHE